MLTPDQVHTIVELLDRQLILFTATTLGAHVLSDSDKNLLQSYGIDYNHVYDESKDIVSLNYQLGMLSELLGQQTKDVTYDQLVRYVKSGQHIPLNERERATIDSIKMQAVSDIKAHKGRIFQDINNVVNNKLGDLKADQREFIREQVLQGVSERKARKDIARDIARLTGDWSRNFNKSVQYISHTALNEGRAAVLEKRYQGTNQEPKMYFQVQTDACDHCVDAYLTNGVGSEPKIFTLKQLQQNGSNIGRKINERLPTLSAYHIHCRCLATEYIEGTIWNGTRFVFDKNYKSSIKRPKIRIVFNNQEYWV